jgi:HlyD family secretion protein
MSALRKPKPDAWPSQPAPVPREVPRPEPRKPAGHWKVLIALAVLGLLGWFAWGRWFGPAQTTPVAALTVRTARIVAGPLEKVMRVNGQTASVNFANVTAPTIRSPEGGREMILLYLVPSGLKVKKGEVIAQIDPQSTLDHMEDVYDQIETAESDIKKRIAEQSINTENLQQSLRVAKSDLDKARLNLQGGELRTTIDKELLQLAVEEAEARHKQLQSDVENTLASQKADLRMLEIARIRAFRHRERHEVDLERYKIKAPMDGLAVVQSVFRGSEMQPIQQGDQVTPGQPLIKVVNVDQMQVEASVNQAESSLLRIGQRGVVRLDAFAGIELPGQLYSMNPMAVGSMRQGYFIRNIPVRVRIEKAHEKLIPDLSASVDLVLERIDNALQAPLAAIYQEGKEHVVFVRRGPRFEKQPVRLGLQTATRVAVLSGVQEGDEVALERPAGVAVQVSRR